MSEVHAPWLLDAVLYLVVGAVAGGVAALAVHVWRMRGRT